MRRSILHANISHTLILPEDTDAYVPTLGSRSASLMAAWIGFLSGPSAPLAFPTLPPQFQRKHCLELAEQRVGALQ